MKLTEKMSYLKGYIDGLDVDKTSKEWKVIEKMSDIMGEMTAYIEDLQSQVDEINEVCENLDEDLKDVETEVYNASVLDDIKPLSEIEDDADADDSFDDDQLYEVTCPTCGKTILLTESMLDEGGIECSCGESLEFDFENILDDDIPNDIDEEFLNNLSEN